MAGAIIDAATTEAETTIVMAITTTAPTTAEAELGAEETSPAPGAETLAGPGATPLAFLTHQLTLRVVAGTRVALAGVEVGATLAVAGVVAVAVVAATVNVALPRCAGQGTLAGS